MRMALELYAVFATSKCIMVAMYSMWQYRPFFFWYIVSFINLTDKQQWPLADLTKSSNDVVLSLRK